MARRPEPISGARLPQLYADMVVRVHELCIGLIGQAQVGNEQGVLTADVELREDKTIYTLYGDWIARIGSFVALLALLYYVAYRTRRKNHLVD